jgi:hypothetical protein
LEFSFPLEQKFRFLLPPLIFKRQRSPKRKMPDLTKDPVDPEIRDKYAGKLYKLDPRNPDVCFSNLLSFRLLNFQHLMLRGKTQAATQGDLPMVSHLTSYNSFINLRPARRWSRTRPPKLHPHTPLAPQHPQFTVQPAFSD